MNDINDRQKDFYESRHAAEGGAEEKAGTATSIWTEIRRSIINWERRHGIYDLLNSTHQDWLVEKVEGDVLDLGCFNGTDLSMYLAKNSKHYTAVDLSPSALNELKEKLANEGVENFKIVSGDILEQRFPDNSFDLIYARSVLHHFKEVETISNELSRILKPNGILVSHDPLQTEPINWFLRAVYRPFQTDADWEWPFSRKTLNTLKQNFNFDNVLGLRGLSKLGLLLSILRLEKLSNSVSNWGFNNDRKYGSKDGPYLRLTCWHVSLKMRNKKTI